MAQQNLRERLIGARKLESYVEKPVDGSPLLPDEGKATGDHYVHIRRI